MTTDVINWHKDNWFRHFYKDETCDFDRLQFERKRGVFQVVWETRKEKGYITKMDRARYVYCKAYGKLPSDILVIHKDGNKYNDELNNLIAIKKAEFYSIKRKEKLLNSNIWSIQEGVIFKRCSLCGCFFPRKLFYLAGKKEIKSKCPACYGKRFIYKSKENYLKRVGLFSF